MNFKRYQVKNPLLKTLVKYFWVLDSEKELVINHNLLPVSNIDLILNFSSPIHYVFENDNDIESVPQNIHFSGIRDCCYKIQQRGKISVIGISFNSVGMYPFLKLPLSEFKNKIIDMDVLDNRFSDILQEKVSKTRSITEKITVLEEILVQFIDTDLLPPQDIVRLVKKISDGANYFTIDHLCAEYGIHKRTLERNFVKYVGISPKTFFRLDRFQKISKQILQGEYGNLSHLAHEFNYYDQNHFIKDCKLFLGCSPSQFANKKTTVKEFIPYTCV